MKVYSDKSYIETNDFDSGIDRDPAYIYGPTSPRTIYFGIKIGNMLD